MATSGTQATFVGEKQITSTAFLSLWQDGSQARMCIANFPSDAGVSTPVPGRPGETYGSIETWENWFVVSSNDLERLQMIVAAPAD